MSVARQYFGKVQTLLKNQIVASIHRVQVKASYMIEASLTKASGNDALADNIPPEV